MKHYTFLGKELAQSKEDFGVWEELLSPLSFKRFIDIGTWKGNLSLYLYLFCVEKSARFYTYDIKDYEKSKVKELIGFDGVFVKKDIFKSNLKKIIKREGKTIIFCDGGNKVKEFNVFSKSLKDGDIIGAHDWGTEINDKDVDLSELEEIFKVGKIKFFKKQIKKKAMITNFKFPHTDVVKKYLPEKIDSLLALGAGTLKGESSLGAKRILGVDWVSNEEAIARAVNIKYDIKDIAKIIYPKSFQVATLFDSIEHLEKKDGIALLKELENLVDYIALFVPLDRHTDKEIARRIKAQNENKKNNKPLQSHLSMWTPAEFEDRGYTVEVSPQYHKSKGFGAMVCVKKLQ